MPMVEGPGALESTGEVGKSKQTTSKTGGPDFDQGVGLIRHHQLDTVREFTRRSSRKLGRTSAYQNATIINTLSFSKRFRKCPFSAQAQMLVL